MPGTCKIPVSLVSNSEVTQPGSSVAVDIFIRSGLSTRQETELRQAAGIAELQTFTTAQGGGQHVVALCLILDFDCLVRLPALV